MVTLPPVERTVEGQAVEGPEQEKRPVTGQGIAWSMRALRHRDFAIFWTGALVSNSGSWLQNVAVPYVLFQLTGSTLWVGLATFAQFLPGVLFGPLGGALADRYDRRRVLVLTQSLLAVASLMLWASWAAGFRRPVLILALVAVTGVVGGLNIPSWQAYVPSLVPRADLLSAVTLNSLQFNAARALGPAVAGLILAGWGAGAAFLLNALSFIFVLAALFLVKRRDEARPAHDGTGVMRQFVSALRYIRTQPGLEVSILVAFLVAALGNPVVQFTVVYAEDVYHVGSLAYGLLAAAMGIGAAVAAPLVSGWDASLSRATIVRYGLPLYGLSCAAFGASGNYTLGFIALVVSGGGFLAVISATNTSMQIIVADAVRGRVLAARVMSFTLAFSVGGLIQGSLADVIGVRPTVTGAGLILAALGIWLATRPKLLRIDDPPDEG